MHEHGHVRLAILGREHLEHHTAFVAALRGAAGRHARTIENAVSSEARAAYLRL
jgi:hypothetical protein